MLTAAIRVVARAAAIQAEEVAAGYAVHRSQSVSGDEVRRPKPIERELPSKLPDTLLQPKTIMHERTVEQASSSTAPLLSRKEEGLSGSSTTTSNPPFAQSVVGVNDKLPDDTKVSSFPGPSRKADKLPDSLLQPSTIMGDNPAGPSSHHTPPIDIPRPAPHTAAINQAASSTTLPGAASSSSYNPSTSDPIPSTISSTTPKPDLQPIETEDDVRGPPPKLTGRNRSSSAPRKSPRPA